MTRLVPAVCMVAVACASGDSRPNAAPADAAVAQVMADAMVPAPAPEPPPFSPEVESLRLERSIAVRFEPTVDSKKLGTVAAHTRVGFRSARRAPGCSKRWIELSPRGWVCEIYLKPSNKPPHGVELPKLDWDEMVPGEYGKVTAEGARTFKFEEGNLVEARTLVGSATVRRYGGIELDGKAYWAIGKGEYLAESAIRRHRPTTWSGVRLGDETGRSLPQAFAVAHKNSIHRVSVYSKPTGGAEVRKLIRRTPVDILETSNAADGKPQAYQIADGQWLRARDVRIARSSEPPPTTLDGERWFDVDLDSQILVAYEGRTPTYTTMISSGKRRTPTPTGIFRVWVKFAETDMNGQMGDDAAYSVATVPWTQFYAKDFALHTAYWHDNFGNQRSHGCVNLAPADARYLYFWSSPDVPPGWSMAHGVFERPGSMVRVRSGADPEPEFVGYARRVYEARLSPNSGTVRR